MNHLSPAIVQHQVLRAIDQAASAPARNGVDLVEILKFLEEPFRASERIWPAIDELRKDGLVECVETEGKPLRWKLTARAQTLLIAGEARETFSACHAAKQRATRGTDPLQVTVCDHREPSASALLCILESDLDRWWNGLDADEKAEVFSTYTLGGKSSVIANYEASPEEVRA